jgi:hypothetical protein
MHFSHFLLGNSSVSPTLWSPIGARKNESACVAGRVLDFADCNLHPAHDAFILSNWGWLVQFFLCATESGRNNSAVKSGIGRFDLGLGGCEQLLALLGSLGR